MPARPRRPVAGSRSRRPSAGAPTAPDSAPAAPAPDGPPAGSPPAGPAPQRAATVGAAELLVVGRLGKPQGLHGELTVQVRTDVPEQRFAPGAVLLTEPPDRGPVVVESTREQGGRLVLALRGVGDRTAAEALRGTLLLADAAAEPLTGDDEYLDVHLQGLRAELADGTKVGTVTEVAHLPQGELLVVSRPGLADALVPFVRAMVPVVDVAGGRIVIDPPAGLLELDAAPVSPPDAGPGAGRRA